MSAPAEQPDNQTIPEERLEQLRTFLYNIRSSIDRALEVLEVGAVDQELLTEQLETVRSSVFDEHADGQGRVVEGVFDGQQMIGADGKRYQVPPNYASKSKLVEGDILKLTISNQGDFVYKQIGPIERDRVTGTLSQDNETLQYYVTNGKRRWKLITAAVTYFHGQAGDEIIALIPKGSRSQWAAVENIVTAA